MDCQSIESLIPQNLMRTSFLSLVVINMTRFFIRIPSNRALASFHHFFAPSIVIMYLKPRRFETRKKSRSDPNPVWYHTVIVMIVYTNRLPRLAYQGYSAVAKRSSLTRAQNREEDEPKNWEVSAHLLDYDDVDIRAIFLLPKKRQGTCCGQIQG